MSKWLHKALAEEEGLMKHYRKLGDKPVPHGLDLPKSFHNEATSTEREARIVHVKDEC